MDRVQFFFYSQFMDIGSVKYVRQLRNRICGHFQIVTQVVDIKIDMRQILRWMEDEEFYFFSICQYY